MNYRNLLIAICLLSTSIPVAALTIVIQLSGGCFRSPSVSVYYVDISIGIIFENAPTPPNSHKLLTAILLPEGTPIPEIQAKDATGEPLVINGVTVQFDPSDSATDRVNALHPPQEGLTWIGFSSTELVPLSPETEEISFSIDYKVLGDMNADSQPVIWASSDSDVRNGDLVFGAGSVAAMDPEPECGDSETLCLNRDGRFEASIAWGDSSGNMGAAQAVDIGRRDSGLFFFFSEDNIEVLLKVLDGCSINGNYWVFAAATTDIEFTLTVTDTQENVTKTYTNQLGVPAPPITDILAFSTCP